MSARLERPRIGLVYSGGISKCAYQLGFTKALFRYVSRDMITAVTGSSCGIFSAYAVAADKTDLLEWMYRKIDISNRGELFLRVGFRHLMRDVINTICDRDDYLTIPLYFPVSFFPLLSVKYYKLFGGYAPIWKKYISAGSNFPFMRPIPNLIRGRLAFDGGASDNIPIFPLIKYSEADGLDLIIVMHFDARYDYRRDFSTNIPILELDVSICNDFKKDHFNFSAPFVCEMLEKAEAYGDDICSELFSHGFTPKKIKHAVQNIFIRERDARQKHSSADGLVSVLNRLGKALRNDADCLKEL